jgi:hypothetical protein
MSDDLGELRASLHELRDYVKAFAGDTVGDLDEQLDRLDTHEHWLRLLDKVLQDIEPLVGVWR